MTTEELRPDPPSEEDAQPAALVPSVEEPPPPEEAPPTPAPAPAPAPPPPPGPPEAERGVSDGALVCTVCLRLVASGDTYVKTAVRGINHLEPCSHRS